MKKILAIVLAAAIVLALVPMTAMAATDFGADVETYAINDKADLLAFAAAVNGGNKFAGKVISLNANIDLSGEEWEPIGGDSVYFAGEFDGNGYTISNLTQTKGVRQGLFGLVEKAYFHDFTLKNVKFSTSENSARIGAIAGNMQYWNVVENVTIDGINITVNGNDGMAGAVTGYSWKSQYGNVDVKNAVITANGTGNVIGGHAAYGRAHVWDTNVTGNNAHWLDGTVQTINGTEYVLQNYWVDCDVNGITINLNGTGSEAGGFIGSDTYNSHSNYFKDDHVTGLVVNCKAGTSQIVGGFMAWNNGTTEAGTAKGFDDCSASGKINGADGIYGGFVGQSGGRAHGYQNATANVDITSTGTAGGFVGKTQNYLTHDYVFTNCEAQGDVSGKVAGGFIGEIGLGGDGDNIYVEFHDCSASGAVKGSDVAGGFAGEVDPELPATNWSTVEGTGELIIEGCDASTSVSGGKTGSLIGYMDIKSNGDAMEDATVAVTLKNNSANGYNASADSAVTDIAVYERLVASPTEDQNIEISAGQTATMQVVAKTGTAAYTYQWYVDRGNGFEKIAGATEASYTTSEATLENSGYRYYCEVSDDVSVTKSPIFTLYVGEPAPIPETGDGMGLFVLAGLALISMLGMVAMKKREA